MRLRSRMDREIAWKFPSDVVRVDKLSRIRTHSLDGWAEEPKEGATRKQRH
jgi:hypothetical protein